jgi:RNA polymerase sigma-70 factor (ECF subfamily)
MATITWTTAAERSRRMKPAPEADTSLRDQQLLARLAQGETAPMAELYDRYGRLVYSLIFSIVADAAVAEELVQEVFVRVWRSAAGYRPEMGSVRVWLLAIAHHRAVDEWRRCRPEQGWINLDATDMEWLAVTDSETKDPFIYQAINGLPDDQRQVVELAYFHGLTMSELAGRLNLPLGTVKSRLRLAMMKLRTRLGATEEDKS